MCLPPRVGNRPCSGGGTSGKVGRLPGRAAGLPGLDWEERFFSGLPAPRPSLANLLDLAGYVKANGAMPRLHPLEVRDAIDPDVLAARIVRDDLRQSEAVAAIEAAHREHPALLNLYWKDLGSFKEAVLQEVARRQGGRPRSFEETRVPYVRGPELADYPYGVGRFKLEEQLRVLMEDDALFATGLLRPPKRLAWAPSPLAAAWALYDPGDESIIVSPLLDSPEAPESVLRFLLYHELLHHEDHIHDRAGGHGPDFRQREARHPDLVEANVWLDTWRDRYRETP